MVLSKNSTHGESEADSDEFFITKGSGLMDRMKTMRPEYDAVVDKACHVNNIWGK